MIPVIKIEEEPPAEACCICRRPTYFWTDIPGPDRMKEAMALCADCACHPLTSEKHLPKSKAAWCQRERIASGRKITGGY